eukprot:TRINITY_DN16001_c0_g1_i2.p1 TRINITY_DN16001_c0_g1~~TRINITY_DN16001_c0_g1_i2.p1  ORF type:complete len:132 (-),score=20.76 TRINITY_DN16001_c0_g1_i2:31-426(-)
MFLWILYDHITSVFDSLVFFFLMIRRPPRSTLSSSSAASDVYKRQEIQCPPRSHAPVGNVDVHFNIPVSSMQPAVLGDEGRLPVEALERPRNPSVRPVSYTHLRAHETPEHLVCRLLLEKKKKQTLNKENT